MKTKVSLLISAIILLTACNQEKLEELQKENDALKEFAEKKDASIEEMLTSFSEIQENLEEIKRKEGIIKVTTTDGEPTEDVVTAINGDIKLISDLMRRNEKLMNQLNNKLAESNGKNKAFAKMIDKLKDQLADRNKEIENLNAQLQEKKIQMGQLYFSIDSLIYTNRQREVQLQDEIQDKIETINEGYFAYGTYKELKANNVLTKEGGFLGLGKSKELDNNFNKEYFSKINIQEQKSFLIYAEKAKLVTNHPTGSYEFRGKDGKVDSLVVTNVEDFWRASKYMVIVID